MKNRLRTTLRWASVVVSITAFLLLLVIARVDVSTQRYRVTSLNDVPTRRIGIIFGALVYRSGKLSPILQDRVDGGIALYRAGKIQKLLMTGDNHTADYNEVVNMQVYALAQGIPKEDIVLDYAGLDTYDSCYRARNIFGITSAILITQQYHAPRATYICRSLGIDAITYALPDFEKYPDLRTSYSIREDFADIKAFWQASVVHPQATIMGKQEPSI